MLKIVLLCAVVLSVGCAPKVLRIAEETLHFQSTYDPTPGDSMAAALADLTKRVTDWGLTIEERPLPPNLYGQAIGESKLIVIQQGLSVNAKFEVLAHELGHLFQPPGLSDHPVGQLFAEMVGVRVQKHYGSKTAERIGGVYLATMKHTFPAYKWMKRDIEYAVACLTGQLPMPAWKD